MRVRVRICDHVRVFVSVFICRYVCCDRAFCVCAHVRVLFFVFCSLRGRGEERDRDGDDAFCIW